MPLQRQRPGGKPGRSGTYLHRIALHYLAKFDEAQGGGGLTRAFHPRVSVSEYALEERRQCYAESRARLREYRVRRVLALLRLAEART
jgi:hypothetical protein